MRTDREKEYLLKAVDAMQKELVVVSPELKILAANEYALKRRGGHIVGKSCHEVLHNESLPCRNCPGNLIIPRGTSGENERISQEPETGRVACYPIKQDEKLEVMVLVDNDPPLHGTIAENIQCTGTLLKDLILNSVDGVVIADPSGRILMFNEAAAEITGYPVADTLKSIKIPDIFPRDGIREVMESLRSNEFGGKGKLKNYKLNLHRKNGELLPIRLNAAIVYEDDREVATIGFFHDLREELDVHQKLEKTQLQLLQSEKMASLGKLAAGVAHQLNNPLGGIILYAKLVIEENDLPEPVREDLLRILRDAQRCRDTVKELLEFTRQTRHRMRPHDINSALNRTLFLLENQPLFQNIVIEKKLGDNLPVLIADIQQLNHLFMNITINAAQAMDGKGTLFYKTELMADEKHIGITISDTGPGIPDDVLAHIFEPFFTTKEEGKGTGLGLSLVYGIVENHGGEISAKSKIGEGTSFFIELPVSGPTEKGAENGQPTG